MFRYPVNPSQDFIKRVIGVGGDEVVYRDKQLTVNGRPWPQTADGTYSYLEGLRFETTERFRETVAGAERGASTRSRVTPQAQPVYRAERAAVSRARELRLQ